MLLTFIAYILLLTYITEPIAASPVKKGNCFTKEFDEVITFEGCKQATIKNKYCHGSCASVVIPGNKKDYKNCKVCMPSKTREKKIKFQCMKDGKEIEDTKTVTIVEKCACMQVDCYRK